MKNRPCTETAKQCATCSHWEQRSIHRGRCHSLRYKPDPDYGYNTEPSDGCKHWDSNLLNKVPA